MHSLATAYKLWKLEFKMSENFKRSDIPVHTISNKLPCTGPLLIWASPCINLTYAKGVVTSFNILRASIFNDFSCALIFFFKIKVFKHFFHRSFIDTIVVSNSLDSDKVQIFVCKCFQ